MNRAAEALYLLMLNSGKLDTAETEQAFYSAYDYILGIAECEENGEERGKVFDLLADVENKARKTAFQAGMYTAFDLLRR